MRSKSKPFALNWAAERKQREQRRDKKERCGE